MLKSAIENHWYEASKIIKDYKDGTPFLNLVQIMRMNFSHKKY